MARQVNDDLDPELLADLDSEADYAKSTLRRKYAPRIKVDRGQAYLIRFLPVEIGANKNWFGRYAQHWVHKRAVFCRKHTSEHLGGDKNYDCKACRVIENGLKHQNSNVSKRAEECIAEPRWFSMVLPLQFDNGKGRPTDTPEPDCLTPHEFSMWRNQFEDLRFIAARFAVKGSKGIVDVTTGQDIWVRRTARGYQFEVAGPHTLWGDNEDPQTIIDKIWNNLVIPDIKMPDKEQEHEFFHKIKEYIQTGGGSFDLARGGSNNGRGGRGGFKATNEEDLDQDGGTPAAEPAEPNRNHGRGGHSPAPETEQESPDADLDGGIGDGDESTDLNPPEPEVRPTPAPAARVQAPKAAPAAPAPRAQATPTVAPVAHLAPPAITQPKPITAVAPTTSRPTVAPTKLVAPLPGRPKLVPPQPRSVQSPAPVVAPIAASVEETPAALPVAGATPEDEENGVAPEAKDSAPPIEMEPTPEAEVPAAPVQEAPPKVAAGGTRLGASLQTRLKSFQTRPTTPTVPTAQ